MKEYSDGYLNQLWRQAVLKQHNNECFFCGATIENTELECHHIIKRKVLLLRYDYRNGIPVCKYKHELNSQYKMSCHSYAETFNGRLEITKHTDPDIYIYFRDRQIPFKQYLQDNNMSRAEFKNKMFEELKNIIKNS